MVAWGTDGTHVFRLFQNPTASFTKVVRSKFYDNPGYDWQKTGVRLYGVFQDMPLNAPVFVDVESNTVSGGMVPPPTDLASPAPYGSYNGQYYRVTLNASDPGMQTSGTSVWGPYACGQQGRLIGLTLTTNATEGNLVSMLLREQDFILHE
jgi:hypothetical protein